jgi:Ca-activated chloride channel family protein
MIKKTTDILISIFNLNHFENSIVFLLFLILPLLYFLNKFYQKRGYKFIFYSSRKFFKREESTKVILIKSIYGIKLIALFFFIIAMARPQRVDSYKVEKIAGLNIMITLDISGSMKALDFHPKNRLEAAKEVIIDFIKKRTNDKLGLVVFAGTAYTKSPLTINYDFLRQYVLETSTEDLKEEGGTAIGVALATAVNRLVGVISNNKSINKSNLLKNNKKKKMQEE